MHSSILLYVILDTICISTSTSTSPTVPPLGTAAPGAASIYTKLHAHHVNHSEFLRRSPSHAIKRLTTALFSHSALIHILAPVTVDTISLTVCRVWTPLANEHVDAMLFGWSRDEKNVVGYFHGPEEGFRVTDKVGCYKKRCCLYCNRWKPSYSRCKANSWCYIYNDGSYYMTC